MKLCSQRSCKGNRRFGYPLLALVVITVVIPGQTLGQMTIAPSRPAVGYPPSAPAGIQNATTGALSILKQAPKVQFEDVPNAEERGARIGVIRSSPGANSGGIPSTVGASTPPPSPTLKATPRRTPRPTPTPKPGIFKRSIRAIPFIGPKITGGNAKTTPAPEEKGPGAEPVIEPEPAFETPPAPSEETAPPFGTESGVDRVTPNAYSADAVDLDVAGDGPERPAGQPRPSDGTPLLRPFPGEEHPASVNAMPVPASYVVPKAPSVEGSGGPELEPRSESPSLNSAVPIRKEGAATASVPPDPLLRVRPTAAQTEGGTYIGPTGPTGARPPVIPAAVPVRDTAPVHEEFAAISATPAAAATPAPIVASISSESETSPTSPTLESNDLNFPNPAVEESEALREKYSEAVLAGRSGDYAGAARLFRGYALNHALSKLAPRAQFLAAILEPNPTQSAADGKELEEKFTDSKYVEEFKRRRPAPTPDLEEASPADIPMLEGQLAQHAGTGHEVVLRIRLGQALLKSEQFDRGLQVLIQALEAANGTPEEAEILILISDAAIAKRDSGQASRALDQLLRRHPETAQRPRVRLNQGLLLEETGAYPRARAMYQALVQESPQSPEADLARERLRDLRML